MLQNQSAIIGDLQNQQEQLENLTYLLQSKTDMTGYDDSVLEQEIYELFINQERKIEYLMDRQREELRKNGTKLRLMIQAEIDAADMKFSNLTDNHYYDEKIKTLTKQIEKLQDVLTIVVHLYHKTGNSLINVLNENQIRIFETLFGKCKWLRQDDGISFSKL